MTLWRIEFLGDAALLLRFGDRLDITVNAGVHACAAALMEAAPSWLVDITPAFASLAVHVDTASIGGDDPLGVARDWLESRIAPAQFDRTPSPTRIIEIPVLYGGQAGPDLADVALHAGICADEAIARHASGDYSVAMLGFAPGFPYLLGLHASLAMPRLATPRTRVAAGSVGIGGAQTGIYPGPGPGGWRLIGCTPLRLFDARRDPPSLLHAGDRVRFVAIDATTFETIASSLR